MSISNGQLDVITLPLEGRNRRVSSNEQPNWSDGNFDMTPLAPGEVLELPLLEGPGVITHIWLTSHSGMMNELNAISMRIFWDDRTEPDVEVPLGDFFAVGPTPAIVDSYPVQVSPSGSLTCYWRMPFKRNARIVFTNDNPDRSTGLYWQVDWMQLYSPRVDAMYFCAKYRREFPAVQGQDYLIADLKGVGSYVGSVLSVTMAQDGWFGEGDDFFYIDGENVPSLQGTGSEDYFNDAWGFRRRTSLWFGQPRWQGYSAGDSGVCYRWHVLDPVAFTESLRVTIEHKGNRIESTDAWFIERPDFLSSVAIWYQSGEQKPTESLPSFSERCVPWTQHHFVRAYQHASVKHGNISVQTTGLFGGRPTLRFTATAKDSELTIPFTTTAAGRHAIRLIVLPTTDGGVWQISIDDIHPPLLVNLSSKNDKDILEIEDIEERDILLGTFELPAGEHLCFIRSSNSNDSRSFEAEMLKVIALPPEVEREPKTYNEAHFVRLAIGRAIYAYRLMYDRLAASLEELVDAELMEDRFLNDENGNPFAQSCNGERLEVTSRAGWQHSWTGLDARR